MDYMRALALVGPAKCEKCSRIGCFAKTSFVRSGRDVCDQAVGINRMQNIAKHGVAISVPNTSPVDLLESKPGCHEQNLEHYDRSSES
jgi:hypothetical protein